MTVQNAIAEVQSLLAQGRVKPALKAAKAAMSRYKSDPTLPNLAGLALSQSGKHRPAAEMFAKAVRLAPDYADARRNLAQALLLLGEAEKVVSVLSRAGPEAATHYLRAQALAALARTEEAEAEADAAVTLAPRQARNLNLRGLLRYRLGRLAEAVADFDAALDLDPDNVETLVNASLPYARQNRFDDADAAARRAVALAPGHLGARLRLAAHLVEAGNTAEAADAYRAVLDLDPGNAEAVEQLAALQDADANAALATQARSALRRRGVSATDRAALHFALARIADQSGDREGAAREWAAANAALAEARPYDPEADSDLNARIIARFAEIASPAEARERPRPVFVLGLPRSGTTLAEAILGAHPAIAPLGERVSAARLLFPVIEGNAPITPETLAEIRQADRDSLPALPEGTIAYVDKMPENYRLIGFLKAVWPEARIVHLRRDPRDVALSMWKARFAGSALNYTNDLSAMAHRFNLYAELMAHWHHVLPDDILDLRYEDLVADVDAASRQLADWCSVEWVPQMAHPERNDAPVLTLSASQLRQPVHSRSVGGWRAHAETLAPFIEGLDPAMWPGLEA